MPLLKDINVVSISVRDWEAAKTFYAELLEWPVAFLSDEMGWMEFGLEGAAHIAISRWDSEEPLPTGSGTTIVFTVDDAFKATEILRAKGVKCDDAVYIPSVVTYGTFYDPEGNRLQFASS